MYIGYIVQVSHEPVSISKMLEITKLTTLTADKGHHLSIEQKKKKKKKKNKQLTN